MGRPRFAILLCTFNGAAFLQEQLDSFEAQTESSWEVWASDDGSNDGTLDILKKRQRRWGRQRLQIVQGPREGHFANFAELTGRDEIRADYFAFSDQDDIWEPEKLKASGHFLDGVPSGVAALYGSRTTLVNEKNQVLGMSPLFKRPHSFANALVQSMAGGNTMAMNEAARSLLVRASRRVSAAGHDWLAYLVVSACGGQLFYDPEPRVRYRQHRLNQVGSNTGPLERARRFGMLLGGHLQRWTDTNLAALEQVREDMTPEAAKILAHFARGRRNWLVPRLYHMACSGIHRQTLVDNVGLWLAIALDRV